MSKQQTAGVIFGIIFGSISAIALIYIIYGMLQKYVIESLEPAITVFLVSAAITGLCFYSVKSKQ